MSLPKTGSRPIVVDGVAFRWRVRSRPTYAQGNAWSPLTVAIEAEAGGGTLVLVHSGARPDNWMAGSFAVVTPEGVASAIRRAKEAGWDYRRAGGPVFFSVATGAMGAS